MLTKEFSKEFVSFLQEYCSFYRNFLDIEAQKCEAISRNDLALLDQFLTTEQALLLKSRGFDRRRDSLIEQSKLKKTTPLSEIIPQLDETLTDSASLIFKDLSGVMLELKEVNFRANAITELRLHRVSNAIKQLEKQPDLQKAYNNSAQVGNGPTPFMSKKI